MKRILLPVVVLLAAFVEPTLAKVDFSGLGGVFRGDYKLKFGSPDLSGRLTARIGVNNGGKRLVIQLYGALNPTNRRNAVPVASYTRLVLTTKRDVTCNSVFIGTNELRTAAKATFTSRNNKLFQFRLFIPGTSESVHYNLWIRKNEIDLAGAGVGGRYRIDFIGKRN